MTTDTTHQAIMEKLRKMESTLTEGVLHLMEIAQVKAGNSRYIITYDFDTHHQTYHKRYQSFLAYIQQKKNCTGITESSYIFIHNGDAKSAFSQFKSYFVQSDKCYVIQVNLANRFKN